MILIWRLIWITVILIRFINSREKLDRNYSTNFSLCKDWSESLWFDSFFSFYKKWFDSFKTEIIGRKLIRIRFYLVKIDSNKTFEKGDFEEHSYKNLFLAFSTKFLCIIWNHLLDGWRFTAVRKNTHSHSQTNFSHTILSTV